jgi:pentatricopeptide repeat protein
MIMGRIERQLVRYGVVPDAAFFDKWVEGAVLHDPNSVGSITGVMAKYGFKLSADSFTGIIRGFATTGLYARAVAAYHLMKESGIEPTATIYASMVIIWTNMGQTEKAGEYFYEMKERFPMGREQYNAGSLKTRNFFDIAMGSK